MKLDSITFKMMGGTTRDDLRFKNMNFQKLMKTAQTHLAETHLADQKVFPTDRLDL